MVGKGGARRVSSPERRDDDTADRRGVSDKGKPQPRAWAVAIGVAALLALATKLTIALRTYGTNDVSYWLWFLEQLRAAGGVGLYHASDPSNGTKFFNHPPFMIHVLRALDWLSTATPLPFPFWLRLPAIVADLASLVLVWRLLAREPGERPAPLALLLLAVAPPSIMISGFHGNTDPVMTGFVVLTIYLLARRYPAWAAGIAFGMGMNIKIVPAILVPALLLALPDFRRRAQFALAAGLTFLVGSLPTLLHDPVFIVRRVFGYGSFGGHWGISRLLAHYLPEGDPLIDTYTRIGRFIVIGALLAATLWLHTRPRPVPLLRQCGLLLFLFLALAPGFGVQYLAWLIPWVVVLGAGAAALFYAASGVFLFLVYTYWSRGFPWYLADSVSVGLWRGPATVAEVATWLTIVALTIAQGVAIHLRTRRSPDQTR